jgi:hypothetical protein
VSFDDPTTQIPFAEALRDAYNNGGTSNPLYNDLRQLVSSTPSTYFMTPNKYSAYATANINLTKEIGKHVAIIFNATNFLNSMQLAKSSDTGFKTSLYGREGTYINVPNFYYGLSLKLKF